jgi:hypothetical protein
VFDGAPFVVCADRREAKKSKTRIAETAANRRTEDFAIKVFPRIDLP